jgi:hypothetical protein
VAQVGGNGLPVGAGCATAEVFDVIFCHVAQCINGIRAGSDGEPNGRCLCSKCHFFRVRSSDKNGSWDQELI